MSYNFSFQNPTRIHFGADALDHLPAELSHYGPRVLLVYGSGSILRTGLYETIQQILKQAGKTVSELSGVTSNPTMEKVREGISLAKRDKPDLVLAVGGGSVLDCAKGICAGACTEEDIWTQFYIGTGTPKAALPLGTVLTMAGTGSEMNGGSVVTDTASKRKTGMMGSVLYPVFSILNPQLTYTVPKEQMVSGICDVLSHILEIYTSPSDEDILSDELAEAILRNLIRAAHRAVKDPQDETARANIMWAATLALGGLLEPGKQQDWMVHQIEHQIGAYTNCPHGLGLAAISSNYYRQVQPHAPARFARLAERVWNLSPAGKSVDELGRLGIDAMEDFFRALGAPTNLRGLGMDETWPLDEIADSCNRLHGGYRSWSDADLRKLLWDTL